jgi:hypothetical protein
MVGLDEPVAQGVAPVLSSPSGADGPDAGGAAAGV